jgi:hypothetical protein
MLERHTISEEDAPLLRAPYQERIRRARESIRSLQAADSDFPLRRRQLAVRHLLALEKDTASEGLREDIIVAETHDQMASDIARRLLQLESGSYNEPADLLDATQRIGSAGKRERPTNPNES